jgi:hypothetical protein
VRPIAALVVFLAPLAATFACTSLEGVSGGSDAPDAAPDVSTSPPEAGPAPTADADAANGPFCASLAKKPTHCLDFDSEPPFGTWVVAATGGNDVRAEEGVFVSASRALRITTTNNLFVANAALYHTITGRPKKATFSAWVRVDKVPSNPNGIFDVFRLKTSSEDGGFSEIDLEINEGGAVTVEVVDDPPGDNNTISTRKNVALGVPRNTWTRLTLIVSIGDVSSAAKVRVSDQESVDVPAEAHKHPNGYRIYVGDPDVVSEWDVRIDDVTIDIE